MPGCDGLERTGPGEYRMNMKMALAGLTSAFEGKVRITDSVPPESFHLSVEGSAKIGFMKGEGTLKLTSVEGGTEVAYEGDAQIGGPMAGIAQRMVDGTSKMMIKRFFEKLGAEAAS